MLIALAVISALLTVGTGYVAFYTRRSAGGSGWDVAFLLSASCFVILFIRTLLTQAAATIHSARRRPQPPGRNESEAPSHNEGPADRAGNE